ncbi:hypothetical protein ASD8599_00352 [Ascidiaceihabitans donghaensis]|uniref:Uncharacterized protein n=1 Tax=Ascidiaceihabitans donghaensis TaxID=1510460 RepID=A0A2R8B9A2_9RHOB|nr:hypothetical protein ASD8599_00352 [Ascidiaceihabitans donghaensis]
MCNAQLTLARRLLMASPVTNRTFLIAPPLLQIYTPAPFMWPLIQLDPACGSGMLD